MNIANGGGWRKGLQQTSTTAKTKETKPLSWRMDAPSRVELQARHERQETSEAKLSQVKEALSDKHANLSYRVENQLVNDLHTSFSQDNSLDIRKAVSTIMGPCAWKELLGLIQWLNLNKFPFNALHFLTLIEKLKSNGYKQKVAELMEIMQLANITPNLSCYIKAITAVDIESQHVALVSQYYKAIFQANLVLAEYDKGTLLNNLSRWQKHLRKVEYGHLIAGLNNLAIPKKRPSEQEPAIAGEKPLNPQALIRLEQFLEQFLATPEGEKITDTDLAAFFPNLLNTSLANRM